MVVPKHQPIAYIGRKDDSMTDLPVPPFMHGANVYLDDGDVTLAALVAEFERLNDKDRRLYFDQLWPAQASGQRPPHQPSGHHRCANPLPEVDNSPSPQSQLAETRQRHPLGRSNVHHALRAVRTLTRHLDYPNRPPKSPPMRSASAGFLF